MNGHQYHLQNITAEQGEGKRSTRLKNKDQFLTVNSGKLIEAWKGRWNEKPWANGVNKIPQIAWLEASDNNDATDAYVARTHRLYWYRPRLN